MIENENNKTSPSIEEICKSTWKEIYRFIYYKVQNREEAEDITQEAYSKALKYLKENNVKIESYIGFLKRVSLNIIKDRWRSKQRHGIHVNIDSTEPENIAVEDFAATTTNRYFIENALNSLSKEYSIVIKLRIIKGYSVAQTAKIMRKYQVNINISLSKWKVEKRKKNRKEK